MAGAISFMNVDWLTRSRSSTLRASHRCRSAPTGSVVDFAIERKRNFRCFVRFSKKFFGQRRTRLACSERWLFISCMFGVTTSDDYRPVAWMGRYPVDVTTILVGLHVACAVLAAILIAFGASSMLANLQFDTAAVWSGGQAWRLF